MITINDISKEVNKIARDYPIKKATLFGSYADGRATEDSDVDLMMEFFTPYVSLFMLSEIRIRIEESLNKKVDVIHGPLPEDSMIEINHEVPLYEA